jgi:amidase
VTIAQWDAVETAERIRRGEVKPGEVIEAAIARAEAAADLGAIVTSVFDLARERAAPPAGVFAGVPTFVKDLSQIRGVAHGLGLRLLGDFISPRSDPFVKSFARTRRGDARQERDTRARPHRDHRAPVRGARRGIRAIARAPAGGSSGGAGALVAAGVVPIAPRQRWRRLDPDSRRVLLA